MEGGGHCNIGWVEAHRPGQKQARENSVQEEVVEVQTEQQPGQTQDSGYLSETP